MTPWDLMKSKGWDLDKDAGSIYVGPRVEYGALKVLGQGYTLQEALENAARMNPRADWCWACKSEWHANDCLCSCHRDTKPKETDHAA